VPDSAGGEILATRVAFLELKDERRLVQEGYELLDEKRVLLAAEIMRQLRHYGALRAEIAAL
jgi:V/A-type H+-transporting ATPase subunit D